MENRSPQNMKKKQLLELINDSVDGVKKRHDKVKELTNEIEKNQKKVNDLLSEMQTKKQKLDNLSDDIQKQHENAKGLYSEINKRYNNSKTNSLKIEKQKENADNLIGEIQKHSNTADDCVSKIQEQQKKSNEIKDKMQEQYDIDLKTIKEMQERFEQLNKRIESLLPGATSAGLASSYFDARTEKKIKWYWLGFVISLIILGIGYSYYFLNQSQSINLEDIIVRVIVGGPLIWLAWYCQKSISQTNRIKEEYHHKQRIMSVFEGFSKQIDELTKDDPEKNKVKKLELISVIINAIRKNPSEILDPSETFLDSIRKCVNEKKNDQREKSETPEK